MIIEVFGQKPKMDIAVGGRLEFALYWLGLGVRGTLSLYRFPWKAASGRLAAYIHNIVEVDRNTGNVI